MKKKIKTQGFKKLFYNMFLKILLPVAIVFSIWLVMFLNVVYKSIHERVCLNLQNESQQFIDAVSSVMNNVINLTNEIEGSMSIQSFFVSENIFSDMGKLRKSFNELEDFTSISRLGCKYIEIIGLYSQKNDYFMWGNSLANFPDKSMLRDKINEFSNNKKSIRCYLPVTDEPSDGSKRFFLLNKVQIGEDVQGTIIFLLNFHWIDNFSFENYSCRLYDPENNYISEYGSGSMDMSKNNVYFECKSYDGYKIEIEADVSEKINGQYSQYNVMFIYIFIGLLLAIIFSLLISKNLYLPYIRIEEILDNPNKIYEYSRLDGEYEYIISKIKKLIKFKYLMEAHVIENAKELKQLQLAVLQEQIKPHFLSNTLMIISLYCDELIGVNNKVSNMLYSVSKMLRYTLDNCTYITTVREEMEYINNYILFQKERFYNRFDFTSDISEEIINCKIIKMTFQPIIENSIYHGVLNTDKKCTISIKGRSDRDIIVIEISNNGKMLSDEEIKRLNASVNDDKNLFGHIGMKNVNKRIRMLYGDKYGLYMKKDESGRTVTVLRFPKEIDNI